MGTSVVLLLAAWVSGAGSITEFGTATNRPWAEDRGDIFEQDQPDNSPQRIDRSKLGEDDDPLLTTILMWALQALLVLIAAAILFFVVQALLRRVRRDPVSLKEDVQADVLPDVLVAGIRESEARLDRGSSSEAIINAWLALERTAVTVGISDDQARTPAELVAAVLTDHAVNRDAIERLATLYREARFSVHPIGEENREAARQALRQVREDLTRPLLAMGEGAQP